MKLKDSFVQDRRGWVRLQEKGGKEHTVPCHHTLERYLDEDIVGADIAVDPAGALSRTPAGRNGVLTKSPMWQQDAYRMIQRRAVASDVATRIGCHSWRARGITTYLENGGLLEHAQKMAAHASARTTKLYDRRGEAISLDEIERISL